ncbi:Gfo/Idh/MocA family protein [Phycisphaerales bacterium AB-hyl4]|uniref:Gfo/Idh/MocA family protein n=1 Tax=Natronomicrosphaera hydrolytica TaxID=3242702 RepID=A0ABV4U416_9BACT
MDQVRLGVIGYGNMGRSHVKYFDQVKGLKFTAVADPDPKETELLVKEHGVKAFTDGYELINSGEVDAVLIATPHYDHPPLTLAAFEKGLHVLCEKPIAVTAKAAQETIEAHKKHPELIYCGMFNQRTSPTWRAVKRLIDEGAVGELIRVGWTIQGWFRTQAYYDSGGWRATWKGEGGGVLINQCPHNLDLFCWFVGQPKRVTAAQVGLGKYHHIEVEDEVNALLEFENGATGTFVTSTAECSGINRLEIVGDNGTIIAEPGKPVRLLRNGTPTREFLATSPERFATPSRDTISIEPGEKDPGHRGITENFINAILHGEKLIAPAAEGILGLELGNAMLMSGLKHQPVDLPTDRNAFEGVLQDLIKNSTFKKREVKNTGAADLAGTY